MVQAPQQEPIIATNTGEMLLLLGLYINHDVQLVTDLARIIRFQLLFHLPKCDSLDEAAASASEAAVSKVCPFPSSLLQNMTCQDLHSFLFEPWQQTPRMLGMCSMQPGKSLV